jgi:glycosyltransferase involved in cell wall biosynthesis
MTQADGLLTKAADSSTTDARTRAPSVHAILWARERPEDWIETVISLCKLDVVANVTLCLHYGAAEAAGLTTSKKFKAVDTLSLAEVTQRLASNADQVLFVVEPVALSADALDRAVDWMIDDPRFGTVSFLSNAAGYLSFPYRNTQVPVPPAGYNETTLTKRLRARSPESGPVPISTPEGGAILVSKSALATSGGLEDWHDSDPFMAVVELGVRASRRGFNNFLDAGTFIWRMSPNKSVSPLAHDDPRHHLHLKHKFFPGLHDLQRESLGTPLTYALDLARAKAQGLRILIDGSQLGPQEMGTQMLIVALTAALDAHPDIKMIALCVPDPNNIPGYAQHLRLLPKVSFYRVDGLEFPDAPEVDIIHRPYQPIEQIPWHRWRTLAKRSIITVQDLIAYRNGAYFQNWQDWHAYRSNLENEVSRADAVFSISEDVVGPIREERLKIAKDALFVVENGVDARNADQPTHIPEGVLSRGWAAEPFLMILGANYSHKNRDFGLRIWRELVARGHKLKMVLVGANVPQGSTRLDEVRVVREETDDLLVLPDVPAEERNWLLKHSALVLYPTAAEGFGQVPFEAARFGRPCLYVSFGPLRELTDDPHAPRQYDLGLLADRAETLLTDPAAARQAIADTLKKIDTYTWKQTAEKSVEAYFAVLGRPPAV